MYTRTGEGISFSHEGGYGGREALAVLERAEYDIAPDMELLLAPEVHTEIDEPDAAQRSILYQITRSYAPNVVPYIKATRSGESHKHVVLKGDYLLPSKDYLGARSTLGGLHRMGKVAVQLERVEDPVSDAILSDLELEVLLATMPPALYETDEAPVETPEVLPQKVAAWRQSRLGKFALHLFSRKSNKIEEQPSEP